MAYIQKSTPPPNKILSFSLNNFAGGLNNRSEILKVNEAMDVLNMRFVDDTVLEKRYGITHYDALTLGSEVTYLDEFKPYTDPDTIIRATNTQLYIDTTMVQTVAGKVSGTNYNGLYFFTDGAKMYVYGKFPQTGTTNVAIVGTVNPAYMVMEVVTPTAGFTPLAAPATLGVTRYNYTLKTIAYEPCANEIADTNKGANVIPTLPTIIIQRKGRLFVSGNKNDNDNIYIADLNNPYYFPVILAIQVPPNSDSVRGMIEYDDSVVVGRENDLYVITGDTNRVGVGFEVFTLKRINSHTGFLNNKCANIAHNYLFFLGSDGNAYALNSTRQDQRMLSTKIISEKIDLFSSPIGFTKSDLLNASTYFIDDEWYVSIKDKVLVYSYRHVAWTLYNNMNARSFYNQDGYLIWGTSLGRVDKFATDYLDFGKPFKAYWTSSNLDMTEASVYKQFREFYIVAHTYETLPSDVSVKFEVDYIEVSDKYAVKNQLSIWGTAVFGDRFINRNINASLPFIIGRRGRTIRITISNGFIIAGTVANLVDLNVYPGRNKETLVYVTATSSYYLYNGLTWDLVTNDKFNQPMRVYQVNGEYEFRGKR